MDQIKLAGNKLSKNIKILEFGEVWQINLRKGMTSLESLSICMLQFQTLKKVNTTKDHINLKIKALYIPINN